MRGTRRRPGLGACILLPPVTLSCPRKRQDPPGVIAAARRIVAIIEGCPGDLTLRSGIASSGWMEDVQCCHRARMREEALIGHS